MLTRDMKSESIKITSGVSQGSMWAKRMFIIYTTDIVEGVNSYTSFFADDAEGGRRVENDKLNCQRLIKRHRYISQILSFLYFFSRSSNTSLLFNFFVFLKATSSDVKNCEARKGKLNLT